MMQIPMAVEPIHQDTKSFQKHAKHISQQVNPMERSNTDHDAKTDKNTRLEYSTKNTEGILDDNFEQVLRMVDYEHKHKGLYLKVERNDLIIKSKQYPPENDLTFEIKHKSLVDLVV